MTLGKLIGRGNTAEVYEWGENEVIKLFDQRIPESLVDEEYQSNILMQGLQLPSPLVKGKTEIDGKKAIIYEKINGNSLTKQLTRNPFAIRDKAKLFSQLHQQIHEKDGANLPKQTTYLTRNIQHTDLLTTEEKLAMCDFLQHLPEGNQVCHGDFHPDNILVSKKQVKVIDWMTATCGNPLGDIARTYIILKHAYLPKNMPAFVRASLERVRNRFCTYYLEEYRTQASFTLEDLEKWTIPVMAARLIEGVHPDEKAVLLEETRNLLKKYFSH
ncbi:phosphotransferase family protein [Bacillus sp. UNC438CL73TsuS30]|uniref:phosphotransferase family protein n=1 Tax=Bacillus sp. UNC438CL73TsuS30 TaxID=1340434 RepID=UPI00047B6B07|nr:phosphotransferase [Bacillus sp. UNC438CL73TsuS30]